MVVDEAKIGSVFRGRVNIHLTGKSFKSDLELFMAGPSRPFQSPTPFAADTNLNCPVHGVQDSRSLHVNLSRY